MKRTMINITMVIKLLQSSTHRFLVLLLVPIILAGCSSKISDYPLNQPKFDMQTFFNGKLRAYGLVQDRSGKVIRRFHVDLLGKWQNNHGILEEVFYYDDGETQQRTWSLTKQADGRYVGSASDVIGKAVGQSQGFAFNWQYTLTINVDNKPWDIHLNDWLYQLDDSRLINRTQMSKWGFNVGEVTLIIEKEN